MGVFLHSLYFIGLLIQKKLKLHLKTQIYDPESNTWRGLANMLNPRSNFGIEVLDGTVVAVGGFNGFQVSPMIRLLSL